MVSSETHDREMFSFAGHYRVQSRRRSTRSSLRGDWFERAPGLLSAAVVDKALQDHPQWRGQARVTLRPALVSHRTGMFAMEPDILYKRDFFARDPGTRPMDVDIVDVRKAMAHWVSRAAIAESLFTGDTYARLASALPDLDVVIANEYYLHEAGHFLGYDVLAKYQDGYFAPGGRTAWPLIYLEETRADLQAFGFALRVLSPVRAAQIFLYNLALRLGVQREGIALDGAAPYGLVPYFLFCVLRDVGFLAVVDECQGSRLELASLDTRDLLKVMELAASHAERELTAVELALSNPLDRALAAARYVRHRLDDHVAAEAYAKVMNHFIDDRETCP